MSEKLCTLRTKGGGGGAKQEETVLWTNSNPTDSSGFANQDVTLSDSLTDYDYVKIRYAYAYNDTGSTFESVYSVSEFVKTSAPVTFGFSGCTNVTHRSNSYFYDRRIIYKTATSITFGSCMGYKASTAAAVSNIFNIPLSIIGIKNMGGKVFNPLTYVYESVTITSGYTETIPSGKTKDEVVAICINFALSGTPYTAVLENVSGTLVKVAGTLNVSMTFPTDTTIGIAVDNYNKAYAIDWIFKS